MTEGVILKSSDVNKALREYNKYWDAMYNKIYSSEQDTLRQLGTAYSEQEYSLNKSYEEAIAEAYAASKGNRRQILSSDLGTGYKDALITSNQDALQKAYEQYKSNYLSGLSDIKSSYASDASIVAENAASARTSVDEMLAKESKNVMDYYNAAYDYLKYLYDKDNDIFTKDYRYRRFLTDAGDNIKTREEIFTTIPVENESDKYNFTEETGELFNWLYSGETPEGVIDFNSYLYDTNPELHEWLDTSTTSELRNQDMIMRDIFGVDITSDTYGKSTYTPGQNLPNVERYYAGTENTYDAVNNYLKEYGFNATYDNSSNIVTVNNLVDTSYFGDFDSNDGKQEDYIKAIYRDIQNDKISKGQLILPNYAGDKGKRQIFMYLGNFQFVDLTDYFDAYDGDIPGEVGKEIYLPEGYKSKDNRYGKITKE